MALIWAKHFSHENITYTARKDAPYETNIPINIVLETVIIAHNYFMIIGV